MPSVESMEYMPRQMDFASLLATQSGFHCTDWLGAVDVSKELNNIAQVKARKISPPPGFHPWTIQPVTSCYSDYTILAHKGKGQRVSMFIKVISSSGLSSCSDLFSSL